MNVLLRIRVKQEIVISFVYVIKILMLRKRSTELLKKQLTVLISSDLSL